MFLVQDCVQTTTAYMHFAILINTLQRAIIFNKLEQSLILFPRYSPSETRRYCNIKIYKFIKEYLNKYSALVDFETGTRVISGELHEGIRAYTGPIGLNILTKITN